MLESSPFLEVPTSAWLAQNRSAFAVSDAHPVAPGHALVVPRRLISSWWEASLDEQTDLLALVTEVKRQLEADHRPDGFNVGFNAGEAAGQTVGHLHIHVIPRHLGDVADPRGGIRNVIPGRGAWAGMPPLSGVAAAARDENERARQRVFALVAGPDRSLHPELIRCLSDPLLDRVDLVVSFVLRSGLDLIGSGIEDALDRGARVRVLTTDYMGITEPAALGWLLDRQTSARQGDHDPGELEARIFSDPTMSFHPKAYLFWSSTDSSGLGFVGSSNVSRSGLAGGVEWNVRLGELPLLRQGFERLWEDGRSVPLTEGWLRRYVPSTRPTNAPAPDGLAEVIPLGVGGIDVDAADLDRPAPTEIQREALAALEATRAAGFSAGLVVMATGLGKTWLAAFDSTRPGTRRVLFVAHREEILRQARDVFRRVRPGATFGLYSGTEKAPDADVVFAGVQTLVRNLDRFERGAFDYMVVDEFHHAAAQSYRRVIDHFLPSFLLGLTATPQRMDGASLLALCNDNVAFECGLVEGIRPQRARPVPVLGGARRRRLHPDPLAQPPFRPRRSH